MSSETLQIDLDESPTGAAVAEPAFDADSLLITPALQQRIDLVEHLIDFGRQTIVMVGPSGIGKTNLLHVVSNCEHDNWIRLHYRGGPTLNAKTLAARLNLDLAADKPDSEEIDIHLDVLRRRIIAMQRGGQVPVLFLDDADLLPMDAVQFILELAHTDDPEAELHVVMTATAGRSALLDDLQRLVPNSAPAHVVELPRFNEAQTRALLEKLAEANGHPQPVVFAATRAGEIHTGSEGIPERIQVLARQELNAAATGAATPAPARRSLALSVSPKLVAALGLMAAVVATGYWWAGRPAPAPANGPHTLNVPRAQGSAAPTPAAGTGAPAAPAAPAEAPLPPGQIAVPLPSAASPAPAASTAAGPGVPVPDTTVTPTALPPPTAGPEAAGAPAAAPPVPAPSPAPQKAPEEQATAVAPTKIAQPARAERVRKTPPGGEQTHGVTKAKENASTQKIAVAAAKPAKTKEPAAAAAGPLDKAAPGTQVIQLFGLRDRAHAKRFIDSHGIADRATIVTSSLNGSPLYIVVYGQYPSRKAAQQALETMPADLKAQKPWIRPASTLRSMPP